MLHVSLDPIQKQGLRLSLGSFRLSPALSLCVGVSWLPFRTRGEKLEQFSIKIQANSAILDHYTQDFWLWRTICLDPVPCISRYVYWTKCRPDSLYLNSANADHYYGTHLAYSRSAELGSARQHLVCVVWSFSGDKHMFNRRPARHILSLFWLLYLSSEVPKCNNIHTCIWLTKSVICIWRTIFSGPTESAICGFACGGQPE